MVRSKFPGKPSKFCNRKLVNVFKHTSAQENENARAAEFIYRGLAIFHRTFGPEDSEDTPPFHGFSPYDIEESKRSARRRSIEVSREIKARQQFSLSLEQDPQKTFLPVEAVPPAAKSTKSSKTKVTSVGSKSSKVTGKSCAVGEASSSHTGERTVNDEDNDGDFVSKKGKSRPTPAISSKRFYGDGNDASIGKDCTMANALMSTCRVVLKKPRLIVDASSDNRNYAWSRQARDGAQPASDLESESSSKSASSSMCSSASSSSSACASSRSLSPSGSAVSSCASESDDEPSPVPKKIVLRKARLEVDTQNMTKNESSTITHKHRVECGVCGAVRFYKFIMQARKFGLWSCESCRKFISRMIQFASPVVCQQGDGKCTIFREASSVVWKMCKRDVIKEARSRCKACWLQLCMKYYKMPLYTKSKLNQSLPNFMRDPDLLKRKAFLKKKKPIRQRLNDTTASNSDENQKLASQKFGNKIKKKYTIIRGARKEVGRNLGKVLKDREGKTSSKISRVNQANRRKHFVQIRLRGKRKQNLPKQQRHAKRSRDVRDEERGSSSAEEPAKRVRRKDVTGSEDESVETIKAEEVPEGEPAKKTKSGKIPASEDKSVKKTNEKDEIKDEPAENIKLEDISELTEESDSITETIDSGVTSTRLLRQQQKLKQDLLLRDLRRMKDFRENNKKLIDDGPGKETVQTRSKKCVHKVDDKQLTKYVPDKINTKKQSQQDKIDSKSDSSLRPSKRFNILSRKEPSPPELCNKNVLSNVESTDNMPAANVTLLKPIIQSPKLNIGPLIESKIVSSLTDDKQATSENVCPTADGDKEQKKNIRPKRRSSLLTTSTQSAENVEASTDVQLKGADKRNSIVLAPETKPGEEFTRQKRKAALNSLANIARVTGRITETDLENKLMVARNLKKKAAAIVRKEVTPVTNKKQDVKKSRRRKKEDDCMADRNAGRGPRVKHVCRSAMAVLGSPVAKFSPNASVAEEKESIVEEDNDTISIISAQSDSTSIADAQEVTKSENASSISNCSSARLRQPSTDIPHRDKEESSQLARSKGSPSPPKTIARTLQDLGKQNCELLDGTDSAQDSTISIDFWESYDPEEVSKTGFALIGSDPSMKVPSLCFLCGSAGFDKLIHCACCCEPYHRYCVEGGMKDWAEPWWRIDWLCPRCSVCAACGKGSQPQVTCQKCRKTYHAECLPGDRLARLHSSAVDRAWVCHSCLRCRSCNNSAVSMFVGNLPLCNPCFKLRQKGNFCPLCQRCYDDDDFDTKMMECAKCECWVHAKCEGLSNEKYEVLSFLPESVEFICRLCCDPTSAPWRSAIEDELRSGYMNVLKSLSKNRKACELLKSSPQKFKAVCSCINSTVRAGAKFAEIGAADLENSPDKCKMVLDVDQQRTSEPTVKNEVSDSAECLQKPVDSLVSNNSTTDESSRGGLLEIEANGKQSPERDSKTEIETNLTQQLQIKLTDIDPQINCRVSDSKPAQFSPHATSQSDSGIGSTDDELKPSPVVSDMQNPVRKQCFCYEPESRRKSTQLTLLYVKKKVFNNNYRSLFEFHQDMQKVLWSADDIELGRFYHQTLQEIFPWFDPKFSQVCQRKDPSSLVTPKKEEKDEDEEGEEEEDEDDMDCVSESHKETSKILEGLLDLNKDYYYRGCKFTDVRVCVLCKSAGDGELTSEGRLLYCGHNEWIHANCALWSNEVFEEIDGSLQNVHSAISRSRLIRCVCCGKRGASVGCCYKNCPESYHFPCAKTGRCVFMEDKTIYCIPHHTVSSSKPLQDQEFPVSRPVYVELEHNRKKKFVPHHKVQIMIGSLSIDHIGEFIEELSDQEATIVPCDFVCTRLFWSSLEPWRLVQYTVRTRLLKSNTEHNVENETNYTLDHSEEDNANLMKATTKQKVTDVEFDVKQVLDSILDTICVKEEESLSDAQNAADLLPPELKDAIFEDLPHDLLDGISMQDIFPKMMTYDDPVDVRLEKDNKPDLKTLDTFSNRPRNSQIHKLEQTNKRPLTLKHRTNDSMSHKHNVFSTSETRKPKAIAKPDVNNQVGGKFNKGNTTTSNAPEIIQLDGTADYSSESESGLLANESEDSSFTPTLHVTIQDTVNNDANNCNKADDDDVDDVGRNKLMKCLIQVDGGNDLTSDSETGSLKQDEEEGDSDDGDADRPFAQLDGTVDLDVNSEDKPVKCGRCHRTYRTALSYQRHFPTCSSDFISSCSESDSSEDDKVPSPAAAETIPSVNNETIDTIVEPSSDFCQLAEDVVEYVVETRETSDGVQESMCINSALYQEEPCQVDPYSSVYVSSNDSEEVGSNQEVAFSYDSGNCVSGLSSLKLKQCGENVYYLNASECNNAPFISSLRQLLHTKNEQTKTLQAEVSKKPNISYVNNVHLNHPVNVCPTQSTHPQVIDYQPVTSSSPAIILQQVPSQNRAQSYPSYLNSFSQQTSQQHGIQYIVDQTEKQQFPMISQPYQLQSSPVQTAVIPTVFGTFIQPNGVEQQVLLNTTPSNSIESPSNLVYGQQSSPGNLYISNQPQMFVNMETVVSNTVMSSSQFVSVPGSVPGMLSTYSATTTQVFQAAKPVIDLPHSYLLVNASPPSNSAPQVVQNGNSASRNVAHEQHHQHTMQQQTQPNQLRMNQPQKREGNQQLNSHSHSNHVEYNKTPAPPPKPKYSNVRQRIIADWSDPPSNAHKPNEKKVSPPRNLNGEKKLDSTLMVNATEKTIVIKPVMPGKFKCKLQQFDLPSSSLVTLQSNMKKTANNIPVSKVLALNTTALKQKPPQVRVLPQKKMVQVSKSSCEDVFDRLKNSIKKESSVHKSNANSLNKSEKPNVKESPVKAIIIANLSKSNNVIGNIENAMRSYLNVDKNLPEQPLKKEMYNNGYQPQPINHIQKHLPGQVSSLTKRKEAGNVVNTAEVGRVLQPSMKEDFFLKKLDPNEKLAVERSFKPKEKKIENCVGKVDKVENSKLKHSNLNVEKSSVVENKKDSVKVNGSRQPKGVKIKMQGCSKKEVIKKLSDSVKNTCSKKSSAPKIVFEINSQDGFSYSSSCLEEAWEKVFEAVQTARLNRKLPPLPKNPFRSVNTNLKMLGLDNNSLKYILEQIPGARKCVNYRPKYHKKEKIEKREKEKENETGCARSEPFAARHKYDMFSWLASRHRRPPKLLNNSDTDIVNGNRRATSLNLPMAMRFRHLKETSKEAVGVFRSDIHGRGLFCLRDIDSGEMVIEYAGEVIRSALTDIREKYYTSKGIGCYMFRIDDYFVVDATMMGNAARFINHSCEPNCYSRVVDILGKKHILIFALRRIPQGEELTYDYKFPLEDDKIRCHCLSRKCRKYLN